MKKLFRVATVPISLNILLKGQLRFLSQYFTIVGISSPGQELDIVHEREGVKTIAINIERSISPIKDIVSLLRLYRHFKKEKPDIVHSITPKAGLLSMIAAKYAGVPIRMHTFTGLIFPSRNGIMQSVLIKMDQLLCWSATNIYPEGNGVMQDLIQYNITKKPLRVLANGNVNGIDINHFSAVEVSECKKEKLRKELGLEDLDFVYIFVGRLIKDKGINELIAAFDNISKTNKNVKLLLVGPFEEELDPLSDVTMRKIQSNPHIIHVGWQSDVRPYFAVADALVFPSYREGFPNVVMQAGAMGLPSIVSNINGCNEIIKNNENGIIIPPKDINALENAMLGWVQDQEFYTKLKKSAREMIVSRYEQSVVWEAILEEYNHLLSHKK